MAAANEILTIPSLKWLGLHSKDYSCASQGWMPLTQNDEKKLERLYSLECFSTEGHRTWREELHKMRALKTKAEIEILADMYGDFCHMLRLRIMNNQWL